MLVPDSRARNKKLHGSRLRGKKYHTEFTEHTELSQGTRADARSFSTLRGLGSKNSTGVHGGQDEAAGFHTEYTEITEITGGDEYDRGGADHLARDNAKAPVDPSLSRRESFLTTQSSFQ
jgi:hypothetical protein